MAMALLLTRRIPCPLASGGGSSTLETRSILPPHLLCGLKPLEQRDAAGKEGQRRQGRGSCGGRAAGSASRDARFRGSEVLWPAGGGKFAAYNARMVPVVGEKGAAVL